MSYGLDEQVQIDFKLPVFNIFQTPHGFSQLVATGSLELQQKSTYALGAANRQIDFDTYHFAENLLQMSFYDLFDSVNSQNTTLKYDLQSKQSSPPLQSTSSALQINLNMMVPQQ